MTPKELWDSLAPQAQAMQRELEAHEAIERMNREFLCLSDLNAMEACLEACAFAAMCQGSGAVLVGYDPAAKGKEIHTTMLDSMAMFVEECSLMPPALRVLIEEHHRNKADASLREMEIGRINSLRMIVKSYIDDAPAFCDFGPEEREYHSPAPRKVKSKPNYKQQKNIFRTTMRSVNRNR